MIEELERSEPGTDPASLLRALPIAKLEHTLEHDFTYPIVITECDENVIYSIYKRSLIITALTIGNTGQISIISLTRDFSVQSRYKPRRHGDVKSILRHLRHT